ncbi:hypothetical protein PFLCHA0_c22610 [Pseudomonas protegens CHA0]|uniref:Uncharacterized protein n=1 Tax=Pseudomonas protegens (strain DSM 19095 / LMG 27888 / CFBP 6595 / CHA0) TaxID=1124983 RepID=A0A2C9EK54_PSEPH|nr:hypothetical protein PFLCHA0_c22610 [Pseudomonas protegens CHA0]
MHGALRKRGTKCRRRLSKRGKAAHRLPWRQIQHALEGLAGTGKSDPRPARYRAHYLE